LYEHIQNTDSHVGNKKNHLSGAEKRKVAKRE